MRESGDGPVVRFLTLIRFSHTIFALPFALGALVVAANGWPSLRILVLVVACMIFARTAAMLFNRLVDWSLDQRNPRTASRHLLISKPGVILLLAVSSGGFLLTAAAINRLTLILAPVALALLAGTHAIIRALRADRTPIVWIRAGAAAGIVAVAVQNLFEMTLRVPANAIMLAVLAAIATHTPRQENLHRQASGS